MNTSGYVMLGLRGQVTGFSRLFLQSRLYREAA